MSIVSRLRNRIWTRGNGAIRELAAPGFPAPRHPAESDLFCRQAAMPGHNQDGLEHAHVGVVGCGGLGSWVALGLARLGIRKLTLIDPDAFDRTNAPRQLMFGVDVGRPKAHALSANLVGHMTNPGILRAMAMPFDEAVFRLENVDALVVGVDNNRTRLETATFGIKWEVPVVFAMLSRDGSRCQAFLQTPGGPCLLCVLPNLDPESSAPCAAASIASCYLAAGHALQLTASAIMGTQSPIWREASLDGSTERALTPGRRPHCPTCSSA